MEVNSGISNLYVNYYYGSKVKLDDRWGAHDVICTYSKIYYIVEGECVIEANGEKYIAKPGDIFLIPAGTKHSFYHENDNYITKYWFHFDFKIGGMNFKDAINAPIYFHIGINKMIIGEFKKIFQMSYNRGISSQLELVSKIIWLVSYFLSRVDVTPHLDDEKNSNLIREIIEYIHENISNPLTVEELSSLTHFHPNYFVRFFKDHMGIPPVKYVNNVKVETAKTLLENTDLPVLEIMHKIGFTDYSHFSKFFKSYSGYSPKAFRSFYSKNAPSRD